MSCALDDFEVVIRRRVTGALVRGLVVALALAVFFARDARAQPAQSNGTQRADDEASLLAELAATSDAERWDRARAAAERLLRVYERGLGPTHPKAASMLEALLWIHFRLGDYERGVSYAERALSIFEKNRVEGPEVARLLTGIARGRLLARDVNGALPYLRRALALREKAGANQQQLAAALGELAVVTEQAGLGNEAIELYRRTASIYEAASDDANLFIALNRMGILLGDAGRYREALPVFERAIALDQKLHGPTSSQSAALWSNLALVSANAGQYAKAEALYQKALSRVEQEKGPNHEDVARILSNLAGLYDDMDQPRRAVPLYERALAIREMGSDRVALAVAVQDLALSRQKLGEFGAAQQGYSRAFRLLEEAGATESEDAAQMLSNWASVYADQGDFLKAEALGLRALTMSEKLFGKDDARTAHPANNLGDYYNKQGKLEAAEPLYRRALAIWRRDLGSEHPLIALSLNNLATLLRARGDYRSARDLLLQALSLSRKLQGKQHSDAALTLSNLANLELSRGNYVEAEPWLEEALTMLERAHGPEHALLGVPLTNLGVLHAALGNPKRAEAYFSRALRIAESKGDRRALALSRMNLAALYNQDNQIERAEPLMRSALAHFEAGKGEGPELAAILLGLASVREARGDFAEAERLLMRARGVASAVEGEEGAAVAKLDASRAHVVAEQGRYDEAHALYHRAIASLRRSFGQDHPDLAEVYMNAAVLYWERGQSGPAIRMMQQGMDLRERFVSRTLSTGSEEQRRLLLSASSPATDWAIGLHEHGFPGNEQAKRLALLATLRSKGRVIEVMHGMTRTLREHLGPEERRLFDELRDVRSQMARLTFGEDGERRPEQVQAELSQLTGRSDSLEAQIAKRSALFRSFAKPVTIESVAARLPADTALVEIVSHLRFDPRGASLSSWRERRYSAYVLKPDRSVSFVDLGAADAIDASVVSFRAALRKRDSEPRPSARDLDERVMRPIRRLLGATRNIIVSADGALNLVPFGALLDERQRYLIDDWSIRYLTTGRELLKPPSGPSRTASLVVAAPAFDAPSTWRRAAPGGARPSESKSLARAPAAGRFDELQGAVDEGWAVAKRLGDAAVLSGTEASVAALLELKGPRILHLATHGFFLGDERRGAEQHGVGRMSSGVPSAVPVNPLLHSGLALAGANLGRSQDTGLLTALEAASLDLWGTRLVVLSACDTGVGAVSNREGVYGLGRALSLAGAETLVASLWKVNDVAASELMTAYYDALADGGNRASSLREVQLSMRRSNDYAHPYYWASFVAFGAEGPLGPAPKLPSALPGLGASSGPKAAQPLGAARGCSCHLVAAERSAPSAWLASLCAAALLVQRRSLRDRRPGRQRRHSVDAVGPTCGEGPRCRFFQRRSRPASRGSAAPASSPRDSRSLSPRSETRSRAAAAR